MKRVLIFSDYFPPCIPGATAGKRLAAFAKYLPEHGWQPIVITRQCTCRPNDDFRKGDIVVRPETSYWVDELQSRSDAIVVRIECEPNNAYRRWIRVASRAGSIPRKGDLPFYGLYHTCYNWQTDLNLESKRLAKLCRMLQKPLAGFLKLMPDATDWLVQGQQVAEQIHKRFPLNAIVSSAPGADNHLMAAKLGKKLAVPFVFDFRDVIYRGWSNGLLGDFSQYVQMRRVRTASTNAKHCFFVTRGELKRGSKQIKCQRVSIIPNGYFSEDMEAALNKISDHSRETFVMRLLGTVYPQQGLNIFLEGFKKFLDSKSYSAQIRFEYFGPTARFVSMAVDAAGISEFCSVCESVSSERSLELTVTADLLILLTTINQSGIPGGKFYEYLGSRRPILAAGNDSEVASELKRLEAGLEANSSGEFCFQLNRFYVSWKNGDPVGGCNDLPELGSLTRRSGVSQLASALENAVQVQDRI